MQKFKTFTPLGLLASWPLTIASILCSRRTTRLESSARESSTDGWHFAPENSTKLEGVSTTDSLRWTRQRTNRTNLSNRSNRISRKRARPEDLKDAPSKRFDISFFAGQTSWTRIESILNRSSRKKKKKTENKNDNRKRCLTSYDATQNDVEILET